MTFTMIDASRRISAAAREAIWVSGSICFTPPVEMRVLARHFSHRLVIMTIRTLKVLTRIDGVAIDHRDRRGEIFELRMGIAQCPSAR